MRWKDPKPLNVKYFAVMTGWGSDGDWQFENSKERYTMTTMHVPPKWGSGTRFL